MLVSTCPRRVTALLVMSTVLFAGELALAQGPPGWPTPQPPPSAPDTPAPPGQTGGSEQPGAPPVSQETIQGDTAAWTEMEAAYKKLNSLSGYREKESGVGHFGQTIVITSEVTPPNSAHTTHEVSSYSVGTIKITAITVEAVTVNDQTRVRGKKDGEPWGPWECSTARPSADTRNTSNRPTVEASRGPDTAIEGTPVRTYVYTNTFLDMGVTIKTTVYVDTQTGLPRRKVEVRKSNKLGLATMTTDYYDYDSKIEITLPPCG